MIPSDNWGAALAIPDLVPPQPDMVRFPTWRVPAPPLLSEIAPESHLTYMVRVFSAYMKHAYGRATVRRVPVNKTALGAMQRAAQFFRGPPRVVDYAPEIAPAAWLCWSVDVWRKTYDARKIPPLTWVYDPRRMNKAVTVNIFTHADVGQFFNSPPVETAAGKRAAALYAQMRADIMKGLSDVDLKDLCKHYAQVFAYLSNECKKEIARRDREFATFSEDGSTWLWR